MPGDISDDIDNSPTPIDYNKLKIAVIDVRSKDEVLRWPLHDCGDGNYNATAFEQCDYVRVPPAPTASPSSAYEYWQTAKSPAATA